MKNINVSRVLRLLWQKKGISRVEIAKELKLDKSTITNIVSGLLEKGMVYEMSEGKSSPQGGRKPIHLTINKDYGCVVGVEIQPDYFEVVVVNLDGNILKSKYKLKDISVDNIIPVLSQTIEKIESDLENKNLNLIGVGIGFSGILNPEEGIIYHSIPLQICKPINVVELLGKSSSVPIFIENDANCCAWGELAFHKSSKYNNFIFVLIEIREKETVTRNYGGIGVGLSIVLNGKVHYGNNYCSGEFRSVFAKPTNLNQFALSKRQLLKINENEKVFNQFAQELSENLALLVNVINVNNIFISTSNVRFKDNIIPILREKIKKIFPYPFQIDYNIQFSSLDDKTVAYGAAGMLLERLFAHPEIPYKPAGMNKDNMALDWPTAQN